MGGETTTQSASTTQASSSALMEQVSFRTVYNGLAQNNINFTASEQAEFEEMVRDEVRKQNNGQLIGFNIGGAGVNIIEILFSFIQNIQKLFSGGDTPTTLAAWGDQARDVFNGATNAGKLQVINTINTNLFDRMKAKGGNLAEAADLVTGFNVGRDAQGNPVYARAMQGASLMDQMMAAREIPAETTTSRTPTPVQVADASDGAGPGLPRRPLTGQALGA